MKTAPGWEADGVTARLHEQFGWGYDAAWNLNRRTNNTLIESFNVNTLIELTSATNTGRLTALNVSKIQPQF